MHITRYVLTFAAILFATSLGAIAQQTIFNVPSGDVLDRGKLYGELDIAYQRSTGIAGFTPRVVIGAGHRIEVGVNINGITATVDPQTTVTPTIKWKAYDGGRNGWAFLLGDEVFVPVQNRNYNAGNYVYAELTKTLTTSTRATFGAYCFTPNVVASGTKAGGQFAIEQTVSKRVTLAADWYTGSQALGYFTPGLVVKVTPKLTWYGTYQIGNHNLYSGNHQFLTELGFNF